MGNKVNQAIRHILPVIKPGDPALENWLKTEVVAACDALAADPSRVLSLSQVRSNLAKHHELAVEKAAEVNRSMKTKGGAHD